MATLFAFVKLALQWPAVVYGELKAQGESKPSNYEALLIGGITTYYFVGYPVSGDTWQQLAMWYAATGGLVAGSYILLTEQ